MSVRNEDGFTPIKSLIQKAPEAALVRNKLCEDVCLLFKIIIPHVNSPYKTSIDERLIFYNITRCYSDGEYRQVFVIAAGDIIKYQGGHIMRNADALTVHSRQETLNSNGGHDARFGDFKLQMT